MVKIDGNSFKLRYHQCNRDIDRLLVIPHASILRVKPLVSTRSICQISRNYLDLGI
ncbi:MAG: hypothetical protein QNJ38_00980 [Prochloraceae cyanobacterium]|nr:hypothetical protein [Prochloraceae cyanobacterium]